VDILIWKPRYYKTADTNVQIVFNDFHYTVLSKCDVMIEIHRDMTRYDTNNVHNKQHNKTL